MPAGEESEKEPVNETALWESRESSVSPDSIEGLFLRALQLETTDQQLSFLKENCADDDVRRRRVVSLLQAYNDSGSFLETPALAGNREVSLSFLTPSEKEDVLGNIGPYEVLEVIGRGGMGLVLRAIDPKLSRIVAVKVLLPELAANPNARRRFLREAQAAAAVSHPHVVTIHAVDDARQTDDGKIVPPFLVMECVVGQSLQQKLDLVGTLRLPEILRISRQIGEGLAAAHKQGLIHRDIKPANVLLENGVERVKITDFGLARAIDDITVTRTGELSGTPQYMSPEQAEGQRVDHRGDLFSLGCVMYAMSTGHSPFRGTGVVQVIKRVTQDSPRPIAEQNAEIPSWLIEIIDCLLSKNPAERFQSAEGVVAVLDQHLVRIQHPSDSGSHSIINQQLPDQSGKETEVHGGLVAASLGQVNVPKELSKTAVRPKRRKWLLIGFCCLSLLGIVWLMIENNSSRDFRDLASDRAPVPRKRAQVFVDASSKEARLLIRCIGDVPEDYEYHELVSGLQEVWTGRYEGVIVDSQSGWIRSDSHWAKKRLKKIYPQRSTRHIAIYPASPERIQVSESGKPLVIQAVRNHQVAAQAAPPIKDDRLYYFLWESKRYSLTKKQAQVLDRLYRSFAKGESGLSESELLEGLAGNRADSATSETVQQIFIDGKHPAWGKVLQVSADPDGNPDGRIFSMVGDPPKATEIDDSGATESELPKNEGKTGESPVLKD